MLEGKLLPQLIYETTDTEFANRAIAGLKDAGISCYGTGRGYSSNGAYPGKGHTEDQVSLYIENESDYTAANDILIRLGAEAEVPPRLHSPKVLFALVLIIVAVASWVAFQS